jgi:predicted alpha/beta hydrolase
MFLMAVVSIPCYHIKHSIGGILSCVQMSRASYKLKLVFMFGTHENVRTLQLTFIMFRVQSTERTTHTIVKKFTQSGSLLHTKGTYQNAECSMRRNWAKSILIFNIPPKIPTRLALEIEVLSFKFALFPKMHFIE